MNKRTVVSKMIEGALYIVPNFERSRGIPAPKSPARAMADAERRIAERYRNAFAAEIAATR